MNVPVNEPNLSGNEKKYLNECIETGWISYEGPFVKRFENDMAVYCNRKHAIAVSNGSAALECAIIALGIGHGDEVIIPTFTIISCAAPIIRAGARPVLVDADPNTWNMRVDEIEEKINRNTKAIMIVHIYGITVDIDPVLEIAKKYKLVVIEDAAEAIGQTYKGKPCGSFGDISCFSFYPNKHITTGEGGMVLTDDDKLAKRTADARNLFFGSRRYVHYELGYNYRMTNMQAAIGCAQFERIEETVAKKREIGRTYHELLGEVQGIQLPLPETEYTNNIYWVFGIVIDDTIDVDAQGLMKLLGEKGIGTRGFFWPMHEQPVFQKMGLFKDEHYPVAEKLARRGFYIPSGVTLTKEQQNYVVESLKELLSKRVI